MAAANFSVSGNDFNLYAKTIASTSLTASSTTQSTTTTNGSFICSGGAGIAKNLNVGGSIASGPINATSASAAQLVLFNTDSVYSTLSCASDGSLTIDSGLNCYIKAPDQFIVMSTADSSSIATGGIRVLGGVGVAKNITIGGVINSAQATDPSTAVDNDMYLNSVSHKIRVYYSSGWHDLSV
jgi:hypothetical protein